MTLPLSTAAKLWTSSADRNIYIVGATGFDEMMVILPFTRGSMMKLRPVAGDGADHRADVGVPEAERDRCGRLGRCRGLQGPAAWQAQDGQQKGRRRPVARAC